MSSTGRMAGHTEGPYGLAEGEPGAPSLSTLEHPDGRIEIIPSKRVFRMRAGDVLHIHTAGGGGYGDPSSRDPAAIERDIREGKVTR